MAARRRMRSPLSTSVFVAVFFSLLLLLLLYSSIVLALQKNTSAGESGGVGVDRSDDDHKGHGHHGHDHGDGRPCSVQLPEGPEPMIQEAKRRERILRSRRRGAQINRLQNAGLPIDAKLLEGQLPWVAVDAFRLPNVTVNFHLFFPPDEKQPLTDSSIQVRRVASYHLHTLVHI